MAHEIYYTSAPQGLRPEDRGFASVAATVGIPKNLWERLEALSGYRHVSEGKNRARNPICNAHWVLHLDGRDYHILSRVCDAGLDYTQRTNSLAHHVALETSELAAAGPAWLISQPGVMIDRWDGNVGAIKRASRLPSGDQSPNRCSTWERLTGDAGWAGVVAEAIIKSPWKPICVLFGNDQDVLPLVNEVVALLPLSARWQVTFNTYFTSLPGGVTCQWRFCLAGTPAAAAAIKNSAASLIIDVTRPNLHNAPPANSFVEAARAGKLAAPQKSAPPAKAAPAIPLKSAPVLEPLSVEPFELKSVEQAMPAPLPPPRPVIRKSFVVGRPIQKSEPPPPLPERSWVLDRRRIMQRRMMAFFALAIVAIGIGVWFQVQAYNASSDRVTPRRVIHTTVPTPEVAPVPMVIVHPDTSIPEPKKVLIPEVTHNPPPPPEIIVPIMPASRPAPVTILLGDPLPPPGAAAGLRDIVRSVLLPADKLEDPDAITSLSVVFPNGDKEWHFKQDDLDGTFSIQSDASENRPGVTLLWHEVTDMGEPAAIATISLGKSDKSLAFTWDTAQRLRRGRVAGLSYYLLQNSTLVVSNSVNNRSQEIRFGPMILKTVKLNSTALEANWLPAELPSPAHLTLARTAPEGWEQKPGPEDETKKNTQSLRLEKPREGAAVAGGFTVHFSSADNLLESDLAKASAAAKADLDAAINDLQNADFAVQQTRAIFEPNTIALEQSIKECNKRIRDHGGDATPEEKAERANLQQQRREHAVNEEKALAPLNERHAASDQKCAACRHAYDALSELSLVEFNVDLPQGLRVGVLRLSRELK